ncbi:MAG: hypothetical protein Q8O54_08125 [Brevundimonas sp.]|nr:hypothetical protein [Brevundimonas sp.]
MGRFEIVVTLLSFVYALALTHVLASTVAMLLERERVKVSLVQSLWMAVAILLLFNNWLSLSGLEGVTWTTRLSFEAFLFAVAQYVACALVSPRLEPDHGFDMVAHHERHGRLFKTAFLVVAGLAILGNVRQAGLFDRSAGEALFAQWPVLIMIILTGVAMWRRERWVQIACAGVLILLMLIVVFI